MVSCRRSAKSTTGMPLPGRTLNCPCPLLRSCIILPQASPRVVPSHRNGRQSIRLDLSTPRPSVKIDRQHDAGPRRQCLNIAGAHERPHDPEPESLSFVASGPPPALVLNLNRTTRAQDAPGPPRIPSAPRRHVRGRARRHRLRKGITHASFYEYSRQGAFTVWVIVGRVAIVDAARFSRLAAPSASTRTARGRA
jgi:hypothetical protein